eukprot:m51a1_g13668 putative long-chain acyl- synthetase 7 (431) ;mRNA; f:253-1591
MSEGHWGSPPTPAAPRRWWPPGTCADGRARAVCACHELPAARHTHGPSRQEYYVRHERPHWWRPRPARPTCSAQVLACLAAWAPRKFLGRRLSPEGPVDFAWQTYADVAGAVHATLGGLRAWGVAEGQRAGVLAANSPASAVVDLACLVGGLVCAPLPPGLAAAELSDVLAGADLAVLFAASAQLPKLRCCRHVPARVVVLDAGASDAGAAECMGLAELQAAWDGREHAAEREPLPGDPATVMYTSGSSGAPKGAVVAHGAWAAHLTHTVTLRCVVMLGYLPLSHVAGRVDLYTALFNGGRVALWPDAPSILDALRALSPTVLGLVPRLCHEARDAYARDREALGKPEARERLRGAFGARLSSVKVTSAPLGPEMRAWLRKALGVPVTEGYGTTEAGSICVNGHLTQPVLLRSVPELGTRALRLGLHRVR